MATWEELTAEQRDIYTTWERQLRAVAGEQARVNNHWAALNEMYNAQVQAVLVALDDNSIVPNTSGLAGAQSLDSDAEAVAIMAHGQGILANYNTQGHRQLWTKAAGIGNMIG
jgi:hypothetical protein